MPNKGGAVPADFPDGNALPLVGQAIGNRAVWLFGGALLLVAILLFSALEARRSALNSPRSISPPEASGGLISAPPSLAVPVGGPEDLYGPQLPQTPAPVTLRAITPSAPKAAPFRATPVIPAYRPPTAYDPDSPQFGNQQTGQSTAAPTPPPAPISAAAAAILAGNRVGATRFANPDATVPQGAVIQAVLETALDSNRPGFVRAIVSRDVRSFDGSKVLIPRGSRLFGEYKAELARGQNRAFIQWLTLTRPDGVQIAVNSPAADQLGRSGVKGDVNSHFFARFAGALLQSTLDLSVGLLTRSASNDTVVIGLAGSTSTINTGSNDQAQPTLKVKHGASVSVFVARDLDFTAVL